MDICALGHIVVQADNVAPVYSVELDYRPEGLRDESLGDVSPRDVSLHA